MFLDWFTKQKERQEELDNKARADKAKGIKQEQLNKLKPKNKNKNKNIPDKEEHKIEENKIIPDSRKIEYNKI